MNAATALLFGFGIFLLFLLGALGILLILLQHRTKIIKVVKEVLKCKYLKIHIQLKMKTALARYLIAALKKNDATKDERILVILDSACNDAEAAAETFLTDIFNEEAGVKITETQNILNKALKKIYALIDKNEELKKSRTIRSFTDELKAIEKRLVRKKYLYNIAITYHKFSLDAAPNVMEYFPKMADKFECPTAPSIAIAKATKEE